MPAPPTHPETIRESFVRIGFQKSWMWIKSTLREVLDFSLPPQCLLCGIADFSSSGHTVAYCQECVSILCPQPKNRCHRCGAEIGPYATARAGCVHCRQRRLHFESVICLGMYEASHRKAMLSAKWSFSAVGMKSLGALLATERATELGSLGIDRVIPIPQHFRQRVVRHFNPACIIGTEIARQLGVPCDVLLLRRTRRTRPQKRISVSQRADNQSGSMELKNADVVRGERVLIVDDVLTTGATCSEAARLLNSAGAKSCHVAVLARVLDHSA